MNSVGLTECPSNDGRPCEVVLLRTWCVPRMQDGTRRLPTQRDYDIEASWGCAVCGRGCDTPEWAR